MAFSKELAIIAQNSATAAATIVASLQLGESDAIEAFDNIRTAIFNGTVVLAGAESVVEVLESAPAPRSGGFRSGGGGRSSGGGGGNSDPGSIDFRQGKYRGKTIAEVYELDQEYLEWAAEEMKNDFLRRNIEKFLASAA